MQQTAFPGMPIAGQGHHSLCEVTLMNKLISASLVATSLLMAAGCGTSPNTASIDNSNYVTSSERGVAYGTIRRVELVQQERSGTGAGAVIGGVAGAVLGNQVGSGNGRAAATVLGAVGGAAVGNEIEKRRSAAGTVYQYTVQLDRGDYKTFNFAADQGYQTGQRVVLIDGVLQQRY
jgi:outer membrane lipoprotein SlyB